jgi:hypothetical protein
MKKRFLILLFFSSLAWAQPPLDKLKATPASLYDMGRLQLQVDAYALTQRLSGKKVDGTSFKVYKFGVAETESQLILNITFAGKEKELSTTLCETILKAYQPVFSSDSLVEDIWPGLDKATYESLVPHLGVRVTLAAKNNTKNKLRCGA